MTLMLLGLSQMAVGKAGMIDLKKVYDTVDRGKLLKCLEQMELKGHLGVFLQELYRGVECEVRVGEYLSEPFEVTSGLRQGCVLSPLLFSLYINGAFEKLRAAKVGSIMCREELVLALLFADDKVIRAEGEDELKRGLGVLDEWCREWGMKVNAGKCGVLHIRRGVKRTAFTFSVET